MTAVSRSIFYTVLSSSFDATGSDHGAITFTYHDTDPLAVAVHFGVDRERGSIDWGFARDLLADGLTRSVGLQDVFCWTVREWFHIGLSSPDGKAVFRMPAEQVRLFLAAAERLVPYGTESSIVDAAVDALLKEGSR